MRRVLSLLVAFLLVSFVACKRESKDDSKDDKNSGKKSIKLAFVSNNTENFWKLAQVGWRKGEKELTGVEGIFRMPKGTFDDQKIVIDDLVDKGIKGLAVSPNDAKNAGPYLGKLNEEIVVICQDNDVPDPKSRRLYIGTDNYQAGRAAGKLVKEAVPQGGKIAVFVGDMAAQNAQERRQGVLDVLAGIEQTTMKEMTPAGATNLPLGKGDYILLATKTDGPNESVCQRLAEDLLDNNADVVCVVGLWAYNPPALLRAKEKTKSKAVVVGFDEDLTTLRAVEEGTIYGTIVQNPVMFGYKSIMLLHGLATKDDSFLKKQTMSADNRIFEPYRVFKNDGSAAEKRKVADFYKEIRGYLGQ